MALVYACIAPHGDELVPELAAEDLKLFSPTRAGMMKLASQLQAARPETIVIASPHTLRLRGHIGVVTSEQSSGRVVARGREVALRARCDVKLASRIVDEAEKRGIPAVGANYGTVSGPLSDLPMDWGTLIPLWFFLKGGRSRRRIVIVAPSREIALEQNFEMGRLVGELCEGEDRSIAFVASADQAHTHRRGGPYGVSKKARVYDELVIEAIKNQRLESIMKIDPGMVDQAKPDSLWQMTMLAGVIDTVKMRGELISYQVPTYYGMLCAGFRRGPRRGAG
jgi:aromatic ring-opening dioxygenase LigB subunit